MHTYPNQDNNPHIPTMTLRHDNILSRYLFRNSTLYIVDIQTIALFIFFDLLLQQFLTIDIAAKILLFCYWQCFQIMQFSTIICMTNRKKFFRGAGVINSPTPSKGRFPGGNQPLWRKRERSQFSAPEYRTFQAPVRSIIVIIDNRKRFKHGIKFFG